MTVWENSQADPLLQYPSKKLRHKLSEPSSEQFSKSEVSGQVPQWSLQLVLMVEWSLKEVALTLVILMFQLTFFKLLDGYKTLTGLYVLLVDIPLFYLRSEDVIIIFILV